MQIFVSVYEHGHGTDVSVHRSSELAKAVAGGIARELWSRARERNKSLPERPPNSDETAAALYFNALDGIELHTVRCCELEGVEPSLCQREGERPSWLGRAIRACWPRKRSD